MYHQSNNHLHLYRFPYSNRLRARVERAANPQPTDNRTRRIYPPFSASLLHLITLVLSLNLLSRIALQRRYRQHGRYPTHCQVRSRRAA